MALPARAPAPRRSAPSLRGLTCALALASFSCASVEVKPEEAKPAHPAPANRSEELLWALDDGTADVPVSEVIPGGFNGGLQGLGHDLQRDHGHLVSVRTTRFESNGGNEIIELAATYDKSAFPMFMTTGWDAQNRLSTFGFEEATGRLRDDELEDIVSQLPGEWSVSAAVVEHPDIAYRHRADAVQPVAGLMRVVVLGAVCEAEAQGKLHDDQRLDLSADALVNTSYPLGNFGPGLNPEVRDLLKMMMTFGDASATQLLGNTLGWDKLGDFAKASGIEHLPAVVTPRGLTALECSAGPLASHPPEARGQWLASLSPADLAATADAAAADAYASGAAEMEKRCNHDQPEKTQDAIAEAAAWPLRTDELQELVLRAESGKLGAPPAPECFHKQMMDAGNGVQGNDHIHRSAWRSEQERDIRSLVAVTETDAGKVVVVMSVAHVPSDKGDRVGSEMGNLAKSLTTHLWEKSR